MKELGKYLFGIIRNNFWMKAAALGIAAVLWVFVITETNPSRIKEFRSIPVVFSGAQDLKEKGLTSTLDLNEIITSANATVDAQTEQLKYLKDEDITLTVDLSAISEPGSYKLPIRGKSTEGNVTSVSPSDVMLVVEDIVTSELPVEVQLVGDKKTNLYYGQPRLNKNTVEVSGARSIVEKYAKAVCYLDIEDLTGPVTETKSTQIVDANGNIIKAKDYEGELPSVIVSLDVYPKKVVPIDTQQVISSITGVAPGYKIDGVVLEPASIELAGPQAVLDKIGSVSLENIVLSNATVESTLHASVIAPDGVVAFEPSAVEVTVQISMILEKKTYNAVDLIVKNLGSGLKYSLMPQSVNVTITGSQEALAAISASQIKPFIDLTGLGVGTQMVAVQFENAPDINASMSPSTNTVQVKLEKK